ncbi:MAG TPA: hypothetical protein VHC49_23130 [Mycobacteriales bacterium]|nr:hypothetical protein [Mycobacteriales bacterium]
MVERNSGAGVGVSLVASAGVTDAPDRTVRTLSAVPPVETSWRAGESTERGLLE